MHAGREWHMARAHGFLGARGCYGLQQRLREECRLRLYLQRCGDANPTRPYAVAAATTDSGRWAVLV
jgi:hypothetical protein